MSRKISAVHTVLGLYSGFSFDVRLIFAEDVGYCCELSLTTVCKDADARLFLNTEWS